jgi:hypothetical protein
MLHKSNSLRPTDGAMTPLTETAIYRFCIAFAAFTFVADSVSFIGQSNYTVAIKYIYTSIILLLIFVSFCRWRSFDTGSLSPVLALVFFTITGAVFLINLIFYDEKASYVTAFSSSLTFAAAAFVPRGVLVFDSRRILKHLMWLFSFGTFCYLLEVLIKFTENPLRDYVYFNEVEPTKAAICVLAISLGILLDRKVLVFVLIVATSVTLGLRPTTSLLILLMVCGFIAAALRRNAVGTIRVIAYGILFLAAVGPLVLYLYFDDVSQLVQQAESYIKEDLLGGQSNTAFRLTILKYAFQALDQSLLFGDGLSGNTTVLLAREYGWWLDVTSGGGMATIHSDFVIVLTQAGIVGYILFVWFFYSMLSVRFRLLAAGALYDDDFRKLVALSIIAVVVLIIDCSVNPFLSVYQTVHPLWMIMFISEVGRKSLPISALVSDAAYKPAIKLKFARLGKNGGRIMLK